MVALFTPTQILLQKLVARKIESMSWSSPQYNDGGPLHGPQHPLMADDGVKCIEYTAVVSLWIGYQRLHTCLKKIHSTLVTQLYLFKEHLNCTHVSNRYNIIFAFKLLTSINYF